jgi:hypothetical protein
VPTPYAEARKRGFKPTVIQPRLGDRRSGENAAEVVARRSAELGADAVKKAGEAEAVAAHAAEVAEKVEQAEASLEIRFAGLETSVRAGLDETGGKAVSALTEAGRAVRLAAEAKAEAEALVGKAEDAQGRAERAQTRSQSAEAIARDASVRSIRAERAAHDLAPQVRSAVELAQAAVQKAGERGAHVVSVALEGRALVIKHSDGREDRASLPEERRSFSRKGRGGSGVGGGLNRTKVLALIEERMSYSESEVLADQQSSGSALTFTFAQAVDKVVVELHETAADDTSVGRVLVGGATPDADTGILIHAGVPHNITDSGTTVVKVYAASGKTISVWGYRR